MAKEPDESFKGEREPEDSISDEYFISIYHQMRKHFTDETIAKFVEKYNKGGEGIIMAREKQRNERIELELQLLSKISEMNDKEIDNFLKRRYPTEDGKTIRIGEDNFVKELVSREKERRRRERREIKKLKSKIPDEKNKAVGDANEEKGQIEEPRKKWWQFWK